MGSKPFRSQDKTESPQELPETASTTSKSSYSFLCGIPNKIDNVATRPVTMRLNDAVSIAVGNNSNTLNENRQSWPNRRLKCLRLCEGDNSVVPMCIQKQYFSICEAGNAEAMRFLMLEYPCHSLNFTQHYEVAVETGESCQTTMLTPLQLVCIHGHVYIAVMLLDRTSTNCNIVDPTYKMTALHFAVAMRNKLMVELLSRQANINVNISDYKGLTPLHIAIKLDSVSMIKTIFRTQKKTLDLAVLDAGGNSVCHLAVKLCALDTVDIILNFLLNDIEKLVCFRKFSGGLLGKDVKVFSWFNLGNFNLRYLQWMNHNTQIVFVDNILQQRNSNGITVMGLLHLRFDSPTWRVRSVSPAATTSSNNTSTPARTNSLTSICDISSTQFVGTKFDQFANQAMVLELIDPVEATVCQKQQYFDKLNTIIQRVQKVSMFVNKLKGRTKNQHTL